MRRMGTKNNCVAVNKAKMGRSCYTITDNNAPHFLTFTVLNWLPIFTRPGTVQIILDALVWRQNQKEVKVYGYVILENHMHCILQAPNLRQQVHDFKAFTAKELLRYLEQNKVHRLLQQLEFFKKPHKTDARYQFWQEGSHPQLIQNEEMLRQKLDYIHLNPVNRGYVDDPVHWRYSSARNYQGLAGLLPIYTDWSLEMHRIIQVSPCNAWGPEQSKISISYSLHLDPMRRMGSRNTLRRSAIIPLFQHHKTLIFLSS